MTKKAKFTAAAGRPASAQKTPAQKTIVFTLDKAPAPDEWRLFSDERPQLDSAFEDLAYRDGDRQTDAKGKVCGLKDDWERMEAGPLSRVGYSFSQDRISVEASADVPTDYFLQVARYVLSETARSDVFLGARVTGMAAFGVAAHLETTGAPGLQEAAQGLQAGAPPAVRKQSPGRRGP